MGCFKDSDPDDYDAERDLPNSLGTVKSVAECLDLGSEEGHKYIGI